MTDDNMPVKKANPAPLGLLGFGMSTVLLSLHNAGLTDLDNVTLAMGIFCGGIAQIMAGLMEYRNGNTFGTTAFTLYGVFWLSLIAVKIDLFSAGSSAATAGSLCLIWGIMTLFMFIGTLKGRIATRVVFLLLTVTFFLLAVGDYTEIHSIINIGGYVGLICGFSAMYTAFAEVLAEQFEKEILKF